MLYVKGLIASEQAGSDHEQLVVVALQYQALLAHPELAANDPSRPLIQSSLGAAWCLLAQGEPLGPKRLNYLGRAHVLLNKALALFDQPNALTAWATTRANLVIVLLTQYEQTRVQADLLSALLTIDRLAQIFERAGNPDAEHWVHAITDWMNELKRNGTAAR
jgi:hypothetical protein